MLGKCSVENVGTAARCADNEYRTNYWFTHRDAPRFSVFAVAPDPRPVLDSGRSSCCLSYLMCHR